MTVSDGTRAINACDFSEEKRLVCHSKWPRLSLHAIAPHRVRTDGFQGYAIRKQQSHQREQILYASFVVDVRAYMLVLFLVVPDRCCRNFICWLLRSEPRAAAHTYTRRTQPDIISNSSDDTAGGIEQ